MEIGQVQAAKIQARTSDGSITLQDVRTPDLDLHSGDGNIDLAVPATLSAQVDARTGDGQIVVDLPITTQGKLGRSIQGTIGAGKGKITLRSGDGSIRLHMID